MEMGDQAGQWFSSRQNRVPVIRRGKTRVLVRKRDACCVDRVCVMRRPKAASIRLRVAIQPIWKFLFFGGV